MNAVIVIGAGEAGLRAARSLREDGFVGTITVLGQESHLPYSRPPLSKRALTSEMAFRPLADADTLAAEHIDIVLTTRVVAVDIDAKVVTTNDGRVRAYTSLIFATGAIPRRLETPGADEVGVHYLRTWDDSMALKAAIIEGSRVVVIGAGFIGLELAAAAIKLGASVTVIETLPRVLGRAVPEVLANEVADRHRAAGVTLRLGQTIERLSGSTNGTVVHLEGGEVVLADVVIAGIGAQPETSVAEAAGLVIDNGIAVDGFLRTSAPQVYAIGDACSFPHSLFGDRRVRLESWRNANDHGAFVSSVIMGTATKHISAVPWFWSDQYDGILQVSGMPGDAVQVIERPVERSHLLFHLAADGRLVGASSWGTNKAVAKDIRVAEMLIEARAYPDAAALANPDINMKSLLSDRLGTTE